MWSSRRWKAVTSLAAIGAACAVCAPAAAAAAPVAVPVATGVQKNIPVGVQLEGMQTGNVSLTFAITTPPAHGTLGPFVNTVCEYPFGNADCTTSVAYTPTTDYVGPDSFSYQVSDSGSVSTPAVVTLSVAAKPPQATGPSLPSPAAASAGSPVQFTVSSVAPGSTINWGDSGTTQAIAVTGSTSVVSHTYAAAGDYTVTVTNHLADGLPSVASGSTTVVVFDAGSAGMASVHVAPGTSAALTIPGPLGLLASLTAAPTDPVGPTLLAATFPLNNGHYATAAPDGRLLGAYDLRGVGIGGQDPVRAVFRYGGGTPQPATLAYFDQVVTQRWRPVKGSTRAGGSLVVDPVGHTISVVLDDTSVPASTALTGTRFAAVDQSRPVLHSLSLSKRCIAAAVAGSAVLQVRFRLSTSARVVATINRRRAKPANGCGPRRQRHFGVILKTQIVRDLTSGPTRLSLRIGGPKARRSSRINRLYPGTYRLTLVADNSSGISRPAQISFSVG